METWIIYVIAPIAIALVSWILGKNGRRIDETSKLVALLQEEITRGEQAAGERQRTEQEAAAGQAAEARRRRTAADAEELRKALDDRFRINSEYEDRVRRLREAEAAGGITAADRTQLETLALRERDEALRRIEGTTRRVASIPRPAKGNPQV